MRLSMTRLALDSPGPIGPDPLRPVSSSQVQGGARHHDGVPRQMFDVAETNQVSPAEIPASDERERKDSTRKHRESKGDSRPRNSQMCEAQQHQHHVRSGQHAKWWNRKVGREPEQTKLSPSQAVIDKARQVAVDQSEMAVHPALLLLILTVLSIRKVT